MGVLNILLRLQLLVFVRINAVPPEACFANFRWDDCGKSPVPVMYYWKPGSRCEVGLWRGCLPNPNMFQDEYECVTTCIFTDRAMPEDYHSLMQNEIYDLETTTVTESTTGDGNSTDLTTGTGGTGMTGTGGTGETDGGGGGTGETGATDVGTATAAAADAPADGGGEK